MSTISAIIEKTENGYRGIYCHWDGYLEHNGKILKEHYRDPDKVKKLIDLGDISILGEEVEPKGEHSYDNPEDGVTVAYHRDRGEEGPNIVHGKTVDEVSGQIYGEYVYVFENGDWNCNGKGYYGTGDDWHFEGDEEN